MIVHNRCDQPRLQSMHECIPSSLTFLDYGGSSDSCRFKVDELTEAREPRRSVPSGVHLGARLSIASRRLCLP